MKSILDPSFKYYKAVDTDLRRTFARIRREQMKARQEAALKVFPIKRPATP